MERLKEIRARLTVLEEGYAVHVECGSEAEQVERTAVNARYACCKCGPVSTLDVVHPATVQQFVAADIRYLFERLAGLDVKKKGAA